jgi:hypothetical protein
MVSWDLLNCVDEWFLPGRCTIPIIVLWLCILLFVIGLLMVFILGLSPKNRHFVILIRMFSITLIQIPICLWVREIALFFLIKQTWERILLALIVIITLFVAIFAPKAFVITNLTLLTIITIYFFVTHPGGEKWRLRQQLLQRAAQQLRQKRKL